MSGPTTPGGLTGAEVQARRGKEGFNEIPEEPPHGLRDFLRRFWGPVAWMLEAALLLELLLEKYPEAAILAGLLVFNACLDTFQERKAQQAMQLLRHRLRVTSRVLRDGSWTTLPARELVPGDRIHLRMGDIVPADCTVVDGQVEVDQAAITGESAAVSRSVGTTLYSSSILRRGEATADVTAIGTHSFYGKTAELVRTAKSESHLQTFLFTIVRYLVTLDSAMAVLVLSVALDRGVPLATVLPFVLILLIASVPAALPATFTVANAIESRRLVEQGVLVTGLTGVQDAASMDLLCVDKTGTLTAGQETVEGVSPSTGYTEAELLSLAAAASDASTQDTIDLAVLAEMERRKLPALPRQQFTPFDPSKKCSEARVEREGGPWRVVFGSPAVVCALSKPGQAAAAAAEPLSASGARVVAVAAGASEPLDLVGFLALGDPPRQDAGALVRSLHEMGIRVMMLTGDTLPTARAVAARVGLGTRFGTRDELSQDPGSYDGFAGVYPEDKFRLVHALQDGGHIVGMTGDGVNDAPALRQAEVGIAVANATDVARASAKLVLTRPGLKDIVSAVEGGRLVYRRMLTWTLNKVSKNFEQVFLLTTGFIAAGIFVVSPLLILLLVFTNDFVTMSSGADNARVSPAPDRWDVREIAAVAAVVAGTWLAVSFTLLDWALHVAHLSLGELQTFFFVYLVFSSQATILVVRERESAFSSRPATIMLGVIVVDLVTVTTLATLGILMTPVPAALVLLVLVVVSAAALAVDQVKAAFIRWSGAFTLDSKLARRRRPVAAREP